MTEVMASPFPVVPIRRFINDLTDGPFGSSLTSSHYSDDGARVIRLGNIGSASFRDSDEAYISLDYFKKLSRHEVKEGDLIIAGLGDSNHPVGRACVAPKSLGPAIVKADCFRARLDESRLLHHYAAWALSSSAISQQIHTLTRGTTRTRINLDIVREIQLPIPAREEQHRIAEFLDAETDRIDRLIQLRFRQLKLWADRFGTFVRQQVTSSPETSKEGSEIDWLGHIPPAWKSLAISRIARFTMGTTFPHSYQGNPSGDYPFIKVSDFQSADEQNRITSAENWITRNIALELGARIVPAGSILYARVGAALLLNRRRITTLPSVIDDNVRAIHFSHGDPRFWEATLSLLDMGQLSNPGPVPSVSEGQIAAVRVPVPDEKTQVEIANRIELYRFNWLRTRCAIERQVSLLTARRQALITAAVTGQFDVSTASGRNVTDGVPTI
ncbi:restriction endonuclease subunit S [Streptomyces sp. NPDC001665]